MTAAPMNPTNPPAPEPKHSPVRMIGNCIKWISAIPIGMVKKPRTLATAHITAMNAISLEVNRRLCRAMVTPFLRRFISLGTKELPFSSTPNPSLGHPIRQQRLLHRDHCPPQFLDESR